MKKFEVNDLRNVCIAGAGTTGKTQLAESIIFTAKATDRFGKVSEGNTVFDSNPDEIERQISIKSAVALCEWRDKKINLMDTPGYADFIGEMIGVVEIADTVIINICAFGGVDTGTEKVWEYVHEKSKACVIFVNRMDRENASFNKVLAEIKEKLTPNIAPVAVPIGEAENFSGLVNLISEKAVIEGKETDVPENMKSTAQHYRDKLLETIASSEDALTEKYLEGKELTQEEIKMALKKGIIKRKVVPLFCGSGLNNIGAEQLLDFIAEYFPSPVETEGERKVEPAKPFSALIFKTAVEPHTGIINYFKVFSGTLHSDEGIYNSTRNVFERIGQMAFVRGKVRIDTRSVDAGDIAVFVKLKYTSTNDTVCHEKEKVVLKPIDFPEPVVNMAVYSKTKGEEDKIATALSASIIEDPTLKFGMDRETKEMVLSGMGSLHLEVMVQNIKTRYGSEIELRKPRIPYKETIHSKAKVQGKYKRQSGGRGQYGDCWIEIEPLERGKGYEFVNKIFGGAIPAQYIPAIEKGVKGALEKGVIAGYPVVDVKITLVDGTFHEVDSSNLAFEIAGSMALRKGVEQASPCILEPIVEIDIVVPEEYMGSIIGDLNSRRGRVLGMTPKGKKQIIKAQVPLGEIFNYATDLRSLTKGAVESRMKFSRYEEAPGNISQSLMEIYQKQKEEGR